MTFFFTPCRGNKESDSMQFDEYSRSLEEYPLHLVNIARWREEVIRPLLSVRPLTRSIVTQRVLEVKASLQSQRAGERMLAVSIASIYRWIRAFQRSNGDLRSLIPYVRQGEDRARSRLHPAVDEIIEKAIREMYGKGECVTIDTLQHAVALLLREAKHTRLDYEQLHIPSRSTIYRRMKAGITKQGEVVDHLSSIRREYPLGTPAVDHTIFKQAEARLQHIPAAALKRGDEALSCLSAQHSCDQKVACWMCDSPARQEMLSVEPPLSNRLLLSAQHSHGTTRERKNDVADEPIHQEAALDPKQWRTMTDLKRCALIQRIKIKHHRLQPLITELDTCAYFAEKTNTREPQCLAIVGDIGVGKTTLVQSWIQTATMRWGTGSEEEKLTLPYLYTCLPALSTPKSILAACLSTLGDPRAIQGSEWTMMSRLQRLVLASSTRMLFIDEFQHLINPETRRIRLACIEILEQLITQVGVSVIFLGSQAETEAILRASPRLERLVSTPRRLHPFEGKRD